MPSETIAKANAPRPGTSSGRVPKAATYAPRYGTWTTASALVISVLTSTVFVVCLLDLRNDVTEPKKSDEKKEGSLDACAVRCSSPVA